MQIYEISNDYLSCLGVQGHITRIYGKKEALANKTGIVLTLGHYDYFIPFALNKWKHKKISNKQRDIVKLDEDTILNINNMIPILKNYKQYVLREVIITDIQRQEYRRLLQQRLDSVNDKKQEIIKKATWLYSAMSKPVQEMNIYEKKLQQRCFQFKAMESKI